MSHQISLNVLNLTESHHSSPNLTESYKIKPYRTESCHISQNLTKSMPNLTKFHQISPKLNVRVEFHVAQYYGGNMFCLRRNPTIFNIAPPTPQLPFLHPRASFPYEIHSSHFDILLQAKKYSTTFTVQTFC